MTENTQTNADRYKPTQYVYVANATIASHCLVCIYMYMVVMGY